MLGWRLPEACGAWQGLGMAPRVSDAWLGTLPGLRTLAGLGTGLAELAACYHLLEAGKEKGPGGEGAGTRTPGSRGMG